MKNKLFLEFLKVYLFCNLSVLVLMIGFISIVILIKFSLDGIIDLENIENIIPNIHENKNMIVAMIGVALGGISLNNFYSLFVFTIKNLSNKIFRNNDLLENLSVINRFFSLFLLIDLIIVIPSIFYLFIFKDIKASINQYYVISFTLAALYAIFILISVLKSPDFMLHLLKKIISQKKAYIFPFKDLGNIFNIISFNMNGELTLFNSSILYSNDQGVYENIRKSIIRKKICTTVYAIKEENLKNKENLNLLKNKLKDKFSHKKIKIDNTDLSYLENYRFACFSESFSEHHQHKYDDWMLIKIDKEPFTSLTNPTNDIMMLSYKKDGGVIRDKFRTIINMLEIM